MNNVHGLILFLSRSQIPLKTRETFDNPKNLREPLERSRPTT